MIKNVGQKILKQLGSLPQGQAVPSVSLTGTSQQNDPNMMGMQAGTLSNSGQWITPGASSASSGTFTTTFTGAGQGIGTQSGIMAQPAMSVGDSLTLVKTGTGEFVLSGGNAQKLLMEYFEQAPEMWLRLMAIKAEEEAE